MPEPQIQQKDLAALLGISPTRLSEVMQQKRKVNLDLARRLYEVLKIDPTFLLEKA